MAKYPPYVNGYGGIDKLFKEIKKASVPPKFNRDFLSAVLGLKSSSYHAMIPFLKRLGFIDQGNVPTQAYKDFRDDTLSGKVMAQRIREAYSEIFAANEYAYKLDKTQLTAKLKTLTGASENDKVLPNVVGSFIELCKIATFDGKGSTATRKTKQNEQPEEEPTDSEISESRTTKKMGISYTINLNLPATTEIEVFNAIFKSLKEYILK
jgi:hypothetical protein